MSALSFKSKAWFYISLFTAILLFLAFIVLGIIYYWFSLNSLKKDLILTTKEIVDNHLVFEGNEIRFKKDKLGRSVSAYLRDQNISAVFLDNKLEPFATYGIYQRLKDEDNLVNKIEIDRLTKVFDENKPKFTDIHYYPREEYFSLITPILFEDNKIGLLQVASAAPLFSRLKEIGLYMLLSVVTISILLSWPLVHILVNHLLEPLESIISSMERARLTNLNIPLVYKGNQSDEISVLVKTYNNMLSRIADGFEKQKAFISNASHELKTPMSRATSSLDIALLDLKDGNYAEVSEQVKTVRSSLMEFSRLIDQLLLLSRIDSGAVKLDIKKVKLKSLVDETCLLHTNQIEVKKVNVKYSIPDNLELKTDPVCLKLILSNLLSNSIKYSHSKGIIDIRLTNKEGRTTINIRDNGIGMSRSDYLHVFDRFFRSQKVSRASGSGVGMALV